jgi:hypothetical protein
VIATQKQFFGKVSPLYVGALSEYLSWQFIESWSIMQGDAKDMGSITLNWEKFKKFLPSAMIHYKPLQLLSGTIPFLRLTKSYYYKMYHFVLHRCGTRLIRCLLFAVTAIRLNRDHPFAICECFLAGIRQVCKGRLAR